MRPEYECVWADKETEETLCADGVEWEVRGVVPPRAIVYCNYCDIWRRGFSITGGEYNRIWHGPANPKKIQCDIIYFNVMELKENQSNNFFLVFLGSDVSSSPEPRLYIYAQIKFLL